MEDRQQELETLLDEFEREKLNVRRRFDQLSEDLLQAEEEIGKYKEIIREQSILIKNHEGKIESFLQKDHQTIKYQEVLILFLRISPKFFSF